jgi:hypothetical protein
MPVRRKMCDTCPFRGMSQDERMENACVEAEAWGCHSESPYGWTDIQCRGHYAAQKKYPPTPEGLAKLEADRAKWMEDFRAGLCQS